jgi:hypothetical protein
MTATGISDAGLFVLQRPPLAAARSAHRIATAPEHSWLQSVINRVLFGSTERGTSGGIPRMRD